VLSWVILGVQTLDASINSSTSETDVIDWFMMNSARAT